MIDAEDLVFPEVFMKGTVEIGGGIQIPADNQPIVLLVEQTVGGYAKIATVISVDRSKLAQATPGDTVCFQNVTLEQAHHIYREQENRFRQLAEAFGSR